MLVIARTFDGLLFRGELHQLTTQLDLTIVELLRCPPPDWTQATGDITELLLTSQLPDTPYLAQLDYYLCGPPPLITEALTLLNRLNVPPTHIHTERFDLI